jgi:hypothetical protein
MMPYYNYRVTDWQEHGDLVLISAEFVDVDK